MKEVPLTQGQVALVDDSDFNCVNALKWHALRYPNGYRAVRTVQNNLKRRAIYLHNFITGFRRTDHRDGNSLNNQKENLRAATHSQNQRAFRTKKKGSSSRFRGVSWHIHRQAWSAQIWVAKKLVHLGYFSDENSAARAYDSEARTHYGEFASPNFPE